MKRIALICLLGLCLQVTAQKNYQPGLVVLTNGDTLKGWIDYRNWEVNPTSIRFKQDSLTDNSRLFTTSDISFFQVAGDKYLKASVTKDMLPLDMEHPVTDSTVKQETAVAFLRVLVEGPVMNLYELYDFKPHYYIQDNTKNYRELTYKFTQDEMTNRLKIRYYFRNELLVYLLQRPQYDKKIARQIEGLNYTAKEIGKVVAALNGSIGQAVPYVYNNSKKAFSFYAGAGATLTTMTFTGQNDYLNDIDFGWKAGPAIMAGVEISSERNFRNFSFRLELAYGSTAYEASNLVMKSRFGIDTITYKIKQRTITPSLTALYNIVSKEKFRYYIGGQFAVNFGGAATNELWARHEYPVYPTHTSKFIKFKGNWPIVNFKTGAIINRKWDISISRSVWGSSVGTTVMKNKVKQYALLIGYHFM